MTTLLKVAKKKKELRNGLLQHVYFKVKIYFQLTTQKMEKSMRCKSNINVC